MLGQGHFTRREKKRGIEMPGNCFQGVMDKQHTQGSCATEKEASLVDASGHSRKTNRITWPRGDGVDGGKEGRPHLFKTGTGSRGGERLNPTTGGGGP